MIEIGRKSEHDCGILILGSGRMSAVFHCLGTSDVHSEILKSLLMGWAKAAAPTLRYHAGNLSSPVAVILSVSRSLKTMYSVIAF